MPVTVPVILSGGAGTRLWPLSRELFPKQLHRLSSDLTLLQETAARVQAPPVVVCNHEHRFIVAEQLRTAGIEPRAVVIEPQGRNTAPAAAIAALLLERDDPDALMLVMPSDHLVRRPDAFRAAVAKAEAAAADGALVTFGIVPEEPNTGYGYIKRGGAVGEVFAIDRFVEKPDLATAEGYVASGEYLWNSGIFLFPVRVWLAELERLAPDMVARCRAALDKGQRDLFFFRLDDDEFAAIKGDSIDYAVMEKTDKAVVVPVDMGWSDIGSWSSLWAQSARDADGNALTGDVLAIDSHNSYLHGDGRLVAAIGLEDMVVVATDDAVLVAPKSRDQDVKAVVQALKSAGRPEAAQPLRTYRPWGWFQTIDEGSRYKVKQIQVSQGAKLSLQKHWHRSEHWVVVSGTAQVTCGDRTFVLRENESTFIPAGTPHRLENPGKLPLRIIEVQSGDYVGEDDIVRLEDVYGRAE